MDTPRTAPAERLVITLPEPLNKDDGTATNELVLTEPTVGFVHRAEATLGNNATLATGRKYQAQLLSYMTKIEPTEFDKVPVSLFMAASRYLDSWLKWGFDPVRQAGDEAPDTPEIKMPDSLLIPLDKAIVVPDREDVTELVLEELTLAQLKKAETHLKDYSPGAVRSYQMQLVLHSAGLHHTAVSRLPISVFNRAAAHVQRFTLAPDQGTGGR